MNDKNKNTKVTLPLLVYAVIFFFVWTVCSFAFSYWGNWVYLFQSKKGQFKERNLQKR